MAASMLRWMPSARASTSISAAMVAVSFARAEIAAKVPTSSATDTAGNWNSDSQLSQMIRSSTWMGSALI
jgi:hypothetical protein